MPGARSPDVLKMSPKTIARWSPLVAGDGQYLAVVTTTDAYGDPSLTSFEIVEADGTMKIAVARYLLPSS